MDFLVNGTRTEADRVEALVNDLGHSASVRTWSAWHCQQKCQLDDECQLASWRSYNQSQSLDDPDADTITENGECRLMKGLDIGSYHISTTVIFKHGWMSFGKDAGIFSDHFESK